MALLKLDVVQTQRLRLTQTLRQSLDLLQISTLELEEILLQELQENPVLECDDALNEGFESLEDVAKNEMEGTVASKAEEFSIEYADASDTGIQNDFDKKNVLEIVTRNESLQEHLLSQIRMLSLPQEDIDILEQLITSLDDNGFLTVSKEFIQNNYNIASEKLDSLLAVLNTMEPVECGVFN
ncbi:MAG TPA: hypothetical protein PLZ38_09215, partial [Spirochaetota bacterium]|nr:hypothetical protein [Spirochaetota bacterium]